MSDPKQTEKPSTVIELIAVERGFIGGVIVEPGRKFTFDTVGKDGKQRKLPKWAAKPGDPRLSRKAKPRAGDLRPVATQEAVKQKVEQMSAQQLAG